MSVHSAARSGEYEIFECDIDEYKVRFPFVKPKPPEET
jgi:hypothetical protein